MNNYYQLYVEGCLNLAETIVVKLDDAASAMNYLVMSVHGLDAVSAEDKSSWKYYQNISGSYHFSDTLMRVSSHDTLDVIDFTCDNLSIHLATREAYAFGSRYYKELVLKHPEQELLILGILYPSDIQVCIDAKDGTIVNYPPHLVESNEYGFIAQLQAWIYKYLDRWVNKQFSISDDLYVATYMGQLYLHLVQAIFAFRLQACKTNEAHSFHVKQYLASHGMLDVYLSEMNKQQALFFYRNVLYLQRHAGKKETFDWLVENTLTKRNLPLYEYTMVHDVSAMERVAPTQVSGFLPQISFKRKPVNEPADRIEKERYSLDYVLDKVKPLAAGNDAYHRTFHDEIEKSFAYSLSSVQSTKLLESSVIDYSDAVVYPLAGILFNHWLSFVAKNVYVATVVIDLPSSGEVVRLEAQDAVALFLYASHKAVEALASSVSYAPLVYVPTLAVQRVIKTPIPPLSELVSMVDLKNLPLSEVKAIHSTALSVGTMFSIDKFFYTCKSIYTASQKQTTLYAYQENSLARGYAQAAVTRLYRNETLRLEKFADASAPHRGMKYTDLFAHLGLDFSDYSALDFHNLAVTIATVATGLDRLPKSTLKDMQKAMVGLFCQMSSYSIQVISDINDSNIVVVQNPAVRIAKIEVAEQKTHLVKSSQFDIHGVYPSEDHSYTYDLNSLFGTLDPAFKQSNKAKIDLSSTIRYHPYDLLKPPPNVVVNPIHIPAGIGVRTTFDFDAQVGALSTFARLQLVDVYCMAGSFIEELIRELPVFQLRRETKELLAFSYIGHTKTLANFAYVGQTRYLRGFTYFGKAKKLESVTAEKTLAGFEYSGESLIEKKDMTAEKTLDGFTYLGQPTSVQIAAPQTP
jgi:hypothetical protein